MAPGKYSTDLGTGLRVSDDRPTSVGFALFLVLRIYVLSVWHKLLGLGIFVLEPRTAGTRRLMAATDKTG